MHNPRASTQDKTGYKLEAVQLYIAMINALVILYRHFCDFFWQVLPSLQKTEKSRRPTNRSRQDSSKSDRAAQH